MATGNMAAGRFRLTTPLESNMTREHYVAMVRRVQAYIAAGDVYQVNLSQRLPPAGRDRRGHSTGAYSERVRCRLGPFSLSAIAG